MDNEKGIGHALSEIIVRCNWEMEFARAKLETEESAAVVQGLQGEIAGYKKLLSSISAEFKLSQSALDNTGDQPTVLPDLEDKDLEILQQSVNNLRSHESWAGVLRRIDEDISKMKDHLLYEATKGAELKIAQGKLRGETAYNQLYAGVEDEVRRRAAKAAAKAQEPDLPFEEAETVEPESEERGLVPAGGRQFQVIRGAAPAEDSDYEVVEGEE